MKIIVAVFIVGTFAYHANAQVEHGTVIVIYMSQNKAAMAGDSLRSAPDDSLNKNECKLTALGRRTMFASSGILSELGASLSPFSFSALGFSAGTYQHLNKLFGLGRL
jgi:hypothetical protein